MANKYDGYAWIKVPKYVMDESKNWEDRYRELEQHHIQVTTFLIDKVRELSSAERKLPGRFFARLAFLCMLGLACLLMVPEHWVTALGVFVFCLWFVVWGVDRAE